MNALRLESAGDTSRWLSARLPGEVEVRTVERVARGVSRETWVVRASSDGGDLGLVVRRDHEAGSVDPIPLVSEYQVYRRLAATAVPVAEVLWFEDDPEWMPDGRPAYVRRLVEGSWKLPFIASPDPADDERRIEASREHIRKLALVHQVDWRAAGFAELFPVPDGPGDVATNLIRWFGARLAEVAMEPCPALVEGLDALAATAPAAPCVTLCKGTNGHGEEVWSDGRIVAMSDWELCCIAEPAYDFAQLQEMVPVIERDGRRIWGWEQALAYYRELTGIDVTVERVEWYRRFYALPMFLFTHNAARQVHLGHNRLVRFAWTGTEMLYQAELRFAGIAGFPPPTPVAQTPPPPVVVPQGARR